MKYKSALLITLVVSSLVLPLIFWQISHQQLLRRKAMEAWPTPAPREEEPPTISEWVPIDVHEFNTRTEKRVQELNQEISLIKKQRLSLPAQAKKLDPLERELQIQQINKEEHNLMDENKDGKIDYAEFNKRDVILANKIYQLRHTTLSDLANGLYDEQLRQITPENRNQYSSPTQNLYRVFVEAGIYQDILPSLQQYRTDVINDWNYQVQFYLCNHCTKEEIKELLRVQGTIGTVFVGDLPMVWFKKISSGGYYTLVFLVDYYFMDLDGVWDEETNCTVETTTVPCFSRFSGNLGPEIFFGRLETPDEANEVRLLHNYFRKNHNYRTRANSLLHSSLEYIDADRYTDTSHEEVSYLIESPSVVYPVHTGVKQPQVTANDFRNKWRDNFENLLIFVHSNAFVHHFKTDDSWVTSGDVRDQKPQINFYYLYGCVTAYFPAPDYIAGWYVFNEGDYGLAAVGIIKEGNFKNPSEFYDPLQQNNHFGLALKEWYKKREDAILSAQDVGDQTLIGDPTLKVILQNENIFPCLRPEKPQVIAGANATQEPGTIFLKAKDRSPNDLYDLCQRKGYLSIWQYGAKKYGSEWMELGQDGSFSWTTPYLSPGNYEWRANLQNKDGQSCQEPSKVLFSVSGPTPTPTPTLTPRCNRPLTPQAEEGPRPGETVIQGQTLNLKIKDVSTDFSCHPLDVVFSLWLVGSTTPVKTSRWQGDVLTKNNHVFPWEFSTDDLTPGDYEWRANLKDMTEPGQTCERPLIIPFSIISETPTPTPTPRHYCCCLMECGQDCWLDTSCSGRQKVRCDLSYCQ